MRDRVQREAIMQKKLAAARSRASARAAKPVQPTEPARTVDNNQPGDRIALNTLSDQVCVSQHIKYMCKCTFIFRCSLNVI